MNKFTAKIQRDFELEVEAEDLKIAAGLVQQIILQFPPGTAKVLWIVPEGVVAVPADDPEKPQPPFGRPNGGGTPGTPVVKQEILVDQIAKVA